ncbi:MAG: hypothetical protein JO307_00335 [Bryobacterales bacterium]|nr:hypothetical protein [Bryobacterales bacterium]MBV9396737.1 hypothetical protein [Bryobacterales bacterium]
MEQRYQNRTRRLPLFATVSLLVCALLNPGNFGTIDTVRRLQVARWIRLGEPPVAPSDTTFGVIGKDGTKQAWYGIGQSIALVPFDALVTAVTTPLRGSGLDTEKQQQVVMLLIAFAMQSVITFCSLAAAYAVLLTFDFTERQSLAGAFALLFATMYLQYVQSAQENNLLLLLALAALYSIRRWQKADWRSAAGWHPAPLWAAAAGAACAFAILVRLPSVLETAALFGFAVSTGKRWKQFFLGFAPPVALGLIIDRWYQWHRFGSVFGTYMGVFGRQGRPAGAPLSYPFSYPFLKGFFGTLFSPDKSIFLFDPLLLVLLFVVIWRWPSVSRDLRIAIAWFAALLAAYIAVYAKYFDFGGDVAWGHRFVTLPVELLCLFAVPLLLQSEYRLSRAAWAAAWAVVFGSVALQAASTAIAPNLEVVQREAGYAHGVIVNRAINLASLALGRQVRGADQIPVEWRSLYYFPFQLRFRFPQFAGAAIVAWFALLAVLLGVVVNCGISGNREGGLKSAAG